MKLYIDGDALPHVLRPILIRVIQRLKIETLVAANRYINIGKSKYITYAVVAAGADEADHCIVEKVGEGDLVVTADIPLADRVITKKAFAIDHRGKFFSEDNIKQSLAMRNLMQEIRDSGEITKGPKPFGPKDTQKFANQLDKFLAQQKWSTL